MIRDLEATAVEKPGGRMFEFRDDDEVLRYTAGRCRNYRHRGAVAFIIRHAYGPPDGRVNYSAHWVDGQGTEVVAMDGPDPEVGKWCWLLDLAVEAGLDLEGGR